MGSVEWNKLTYEIFSDLENQWFSTSAATPTRLPPTRILSIDGGGSNGLKSIMAARALVHLENSIQSKTSDPNARIADHFDIITGSGLGGLLASMLLCDDGRGRPLYTATQAIETIIRAAKRLYKKNRFRRRLCSRRSCGDAIRVMFRIDGRDATMRDSLKPLLVPCYDLDTRAPFVFSRADARGCASFDFPLWEVCRAAMAAPGRFEAVRVRSLDGVVGCRGVDAGVVMNNPAAMAVTHVLNNPCEFPRARRVEDLLVLSIGNARSDGGGGGVVDIAADGNSDAVDQILCNIFGGGAARRNYVRIQANRSISEMVVIGRSLAHEAMLSAGEIMLREKRMESEWTPFGGKKSAAKTNAECLEEFVDLIISTVRSPSK
ncbi:Patatin-3-Kuras 1 [Acorus calamus]|uniref:Patatin n=1 Tax=Acorus calamus TaxID=4465 RepID=A0AAV9ENY5_ACOCL|nr:Patatin-3-Kuras 1 [Acorus calamus]